MTVITPCHWTISFKKCSPLSGKGARAFEENRISLLIYSVLLIQIQNEKIRQSYKMARMENFVELAHVTLYSHSALSQPEITFYLKEFMTLRPSLRDAASNGLTSGRGNCSHRFSKADNHVAQSHQSMMARRISKWQDALLEEQKKRCGKISKINRPILSVSNTICKYHGNSNPVATTQNNYLHALD